MLVQIGDFVRVFDSPDEGWEYVNDNPQKAYAVECFLEEVQDA